MKYDVAKVFIDEESLDIAMIAMSGASRRMYLATIDLPPRVEQRVFGSLNKAAEWVKSMYLSNPGAVNASITVQTEDKILYLVRK